MVKGLNIIITAPETKFASTSFDANPTTAVAIPALAKSEVDIDFMPGTSEMANPR